MTTPDPTRMAETSAWLQRTSQDMRAAAHALTADPPLLDDAVFHCQQACEKALRAFLNWNGVPYRETHDLAEIGALCVEIDPTLESIVAQAAPLTDYAWRYRYPGGPDEPSHQETSEALQVTHTVSQAIIDRLPDEFRKS
jgi:HEPN domain-containing protein